MTQKELVGITKSYFEGLATEALTKALQSIAPFLLVPPFSMLTNRFIAWIVGRIADFIELAGFFIYVDIRTSQQGKDYVNAKMQLKEAINSGNLIKVKEAEDNVKTTFNKLISLKL